jgi:NitT/TauT family transport system substrate-binding protein
MTGYRAKWSQASRQALYLCLLVLFVGLGLSCTSRERHVRVGITPYQDTAVPVVADKLGWYRENGIDVEFVPLAWGDVMVSLASGSIDASIYTINAFEPAYASASLGSRKPVFYCPLYVFKGTAIMIHGNSGIKPFRESLGATVAQRDAGVADAARQLKGKRIAVTEGTEYEQIVLAALAMAKLNPRTDVTIIHASPEDSLAAFLSGNIDAFGAGLTERVEARRHGGTELLVAGDVGQPSINGIVTTSAFASENQVTLDALTKTWFRTVQFVGADPKKNSEIVREYLAGRASTRYTDEEYAIAWTFDVFPSDPHAAADLFNRESSPYYWKVAWSKTSQFLVDQKKIVSPVPESAYWGEEVLNRLQGETGK